MPSTPDINAFYRQAQTRSGEFRIRTDHPDTLVLEPHRGGFAGRAVRWLRSKITRSSNRYHADSIRAAQAFERALQAYYGKAATQRLVSQGGLVSSRPITSRNIKRIVQKLNKEHTQHLKTIIANAKLRPNDGFELLANLATRNLLDSHGARALLSEVDWPENSSVKAAYKLFQRGINLSPDKAIALNAAITTAEDTGNIQEFYESLRDGDVLNDPDIMPLLQNIPTRISDPDCQHLHRLIAHGLFSSLRSPPPGALVMKDGQPYLEHKTENLPTAMSSFNREFRTQLQDISFGPDSTSMTPDQITPFVDKDGKLDVQGVLDNLPKDKQFSMDFFRDIKSNTSYEIAGHECINKPKQAIHALWNICDGNPQQFTALCNLLTQKTWMPLYSAPILNLLGQRDENYLTAQHGANDNRSYKIDLLAPNVISLRFVSDVSSGDMEFAKTHENGSASTFQTTNGASMRKYYALRVDLMRHSLLFSGAQSYAELRGPLQGFQPLRT